MLFLRFFYFILFVCFFVFFFFFSSRRRHTRFDCDWSSDVCSSDLVARLFDDPLHEAVIVGNDHAEALIIFDLLGPDHTSRSEERREGKSVDLGGRRIIKKKKKRKKN